LQAIITDGAVGSLFDFRFVGGIGHFDRPKSSHKARPPSSNRGYFPVHYIIHGQSNHGRDVGRSLLFSEIDSN
jgi:hypothetical protein